MSSTEKDAALLGRVNALQEMSPPTDWLEILELVGGNNTTFEQSEQLCKKIISHQTFLPAAVACIVKRSAGHIAALQLMLVFCTACDSPTWWQTHKFHQICIAMCLSGAVSQRVLASKCLQAMCVRSSCFYADLRTLHNDGTTEWALRALKRHATRHDRPELFSPAVACLRALLDCKGAREAILSGKVPAMLQQIQSACRLNRASVDAYSELLRCMQLWLVRPRRAKRTLPRAAPSGAVEASKAFHHLQAMAADSGVEAPAVAPVTAEADVPSMPANPSGVSSSGLFGAGQPPAKPPRQQDTPHTGSASDSGALPQPLRSEHQDRQLQDLREAGLDVDALPASLLHLFMDGGGSTGGAAAGGHSDSESDASPGPSSLLAGHTVFPGAEPHDVGSVRGEQAAAAAAGGNRYSAAHYGSDSSSD